MSASANVAGGDPSRISPTAHYTSYVWVRNGMSHPALGSALGRALHAALRPINAGYRRLARMPDLDTMLLARHRLIDHLLARAIDDGRVTQVLEVAAGLSPRGFQFARRYPELVYVEADLPEMAAHKRRVLDAAGLRGARHQVVEIDALVDDGPDSVGAVARAHLDPAGGAAIITEGLLNYFDTAAVLAMWRRFARCLGGFPRGLYLSDLNTRGDLGHLLAARAFQRALSAFARGQVHLHFETPRDVEAALRECGFDDAAVHAPAAFRGELDVPASDRGHLVRVLEATVTAAARR